MGINKNKDGTYYVSFSKRHPVTRVPKSLTRYKNEKREPITSMAEAKRIYNLLVAQVHDGLKRTICPTWKKACEDVIAHKVSVTEWNLKTASTYQVCLQAYTYEKWGDRLVDSFTPQEIRNLILEEMKDCAVSHQKNLLKYIKAVFTFCSDNGFISGSPVPTIKFKTVNKLKGVLSASQIKLLLNTAKELEHPWYYTWAVASYTGMRSGELFALTWEQVDFERRRIKVDRAWNSKEGLKDLTKSGDDRWVELSPFLMPILSELKLKTGVTKFVLPRFEEWERGEQARVLRAFLQGIGLPRIRFHDLRASWATILLSCGVKPIVVMKIGGWKDLKTMERYVRLSGIETEGALDELELHNSSRTFAEILDFSIDGSGK